MIYQHGNAKYSGRTQGNNNLSAKNINEKKYLNSVVGMALTKAQKKKMLKKQAKEKARLDIKEESDWESMSSDEEQNE